MQSRVHLTRDFSWQGRLEPHFNAFYHQASFSFLSVLLWHYLVFQTATTPSWSRWTPRWVRPSPSPRARPPRTGTHPGPPPRPITTTTTTTNSPATAAVLASTYSRPRIVEDLVTQSRTPPPPPPSSGQKSKMWSQRIVAEWDTIPAAQAVGSIFSMIVKYHLSAACPARAPELCRNS